jgi:apolipoprotein N-acyltransferase
VEPNATAPAPAPFPNPAKPGVFRRVARTLFPSPTDIAAHRRPLLLVLISALFSALIFHQNPLGLLGWIAVVPLFIALHHLRGKLLFWTALAFGFTWYYLSAFWLHTLVVFHWLIPLGVTAGSFYMGAYFILFAIPAAWCCRQIHPVVRSFALATCWTGVEYLRNFTDMGFPWNLLGHSQAPWNVGHMQLAAYGGVSLLSFLMALVNAAIAVAILQIRHEGFRAARFAAITAPAFVLLVALSLLGFQNVVVKPIRSLQVSIIQQGISQVQRWQASMGVPGDTPEAAQRRWIETETLMLERIASLTRAAAANDKPQLMVMPESNFLTIGFPYASQLQQDLVSLSKETNADLFFGADNLLEQESYDLASAAGQRFLLPGESPAAYEVPPMPVLKNADGTTAPDVQAINSMIPTVAAWHISRTGGVETRVYNKMQLVPFGEQVPFISGIRWLQEKFALAGIAGAYKPGLQNTIFEVQSAERISPAPRKYRFGSVICFESTFSHLTRSLARAGAEFICVLTNDSWYDPNYAIDEGGFWGTVFSLPGINQLASAGPKQHLIQSQFRSVETGRPIVRSANTGISAFIAENGTIQKELAYGQSGYLSDSLSLPENPRTTFFVRYGEWLGKLCLGTWAAIMCLLIIARPKSSGSRFALHK